MSVTFRPTVASPEPLVLDAVAKRYGQGRYVFSDLDYTFAPGSAIGLIGPNGTGKTTLLRLLATESYPTTGHVRYGAVNIHEHPYRYLAHVGIVHDSANLPQYLSAVELLEYVLRQRQQWDDETSPPRIAALLDSLDLDERREALIGTYSSGMFKKAQIAAALVASPSVLLMDEPFRGLDETSTQAAIELIQAFKQAGGLLIVSSHIKTAFSTFCDDYIDFNALTPERADLT